MNLEQRLNKVAPKLKEKYDTAKAANVGDTIQCPVCGQRIVKTTYHKVFCSNQKTKKNGNCKDQYWNVVDEVRRVKTLKRLKQDIKSEELKFIENFLDL